MNSMSRRREQHHRGPPRGSPEHQTLAALRRAHRQLDLKLELIVGRSDGEQALLEGDRGRGCGGGEQQRNRDRGLGSRRCSID
jgi:hypothetical protein